MNDLLIQLRRALPTLAKPMSLQLLNLGLGVPAGVLAARLLGVTQRGELAIFVATSFMISTILGLCLHEALPFLVRSGRPAPAAVGTAVSLQLGLGLAAAVTSFLVPLTPGLPHSTADAIRRTQPYFAVACIAYAVNHAVSSGALACSGALSFIRIETARVGSYLFGLVVFLFVFRWGLYGALSAFLLGLSAQIAVALREVLRTTTGLSWDRSLAVEQLRYGVQALPGRIAEYLFTGGGDALLMSIATGPGGVGYYVVARSVADLTLMPAVAGALLVQGDTRRIEHTGQLLVAVVTLVAIGVLGLAAVGPWLIAWAFGVQFAPSGAVLRILLLAVPGLMTVRMLGAWNAREGKPRRTSFAVGLSAVILAMMIPPAGRMGGIQGAVAAFAAVVWLQAIILVALHVRGASSGLPTQPPSAIAR